MPPTSCASKSVVMATRLPEFPNLRDLCLPPSVPEERVATFIVMYRAHCQRLLDTIIHGVFEEVHSFIIQFHSFSNSKFEIPVILLTFLCHYYLIIIITGLTQINCICISRNCVILRTFLCRYRGSLKISTELTRLNPILMFFIGRIT